MNTLLYLVINGLAVIQLVCGQGAKTQWAASMGGGGGGTGSGFSFPEPTEFAINNALQQIAMAPNENAVIQAGVSVHTPGRDLTDRVVDAIEHRIAQLRTPPGWMYRLPPPLPSWFDAARAVEAAFNGQPTASFLAPMPTMGGAAGMGAPGVPGMGLGALRPGFPPRFQEPRNYEINIAIHDIHTATTEAGAAKAAAMVHRPGVDLADAVVNAFENKIAQLRALPRMPMTFNPLPLIMAAYRLHWAKQLMSPNSGPANKPAAPKPPSRPGFGPGPPPGPAFGPGPRNQGPHPSNRMNQNMQNRRAPPGPRRNQNRFSGPPSSFRRPLRKPKAPPKDLSGLPERYKRPLMELHRMVPQSNPPPHEPHLPNRYRQKMQRPREFSRNARRDPPSRPHAPTRPPTQPPTYPPTYPPSPPPTNPPTYPTEPARPPPSSFERNRPSAFQADPNFQSAPPHRPAPPPQAERAPPRRQQSQSNIPPEFAPPLEYPPPPQQAIETRRNNRNRNNRPKSPPRPAPEPKMSSKPSDLLFVGNENQFQSAPADLSPKSLWKPMVDLGVQINDIISNSGKGATYKTSFSAPSRNLRKTKASKQFQLRAAPTSTEFGVSTPRPRKEPTTTTTPPPTPPNPRNHLNMLKNGGLKEKMKILKTEKVKKKPSPSDQPTESTPIKSPDGNKMTQLKTLLEGIAPSKLQAIVDILKSRDGSSSGGPTSAGSSSFDVPSRQRGPPPPPPGSSNFGPGREVRGGRRGSSRRGPPSGPPGGASSRGDPRGSFSSRDMGGPGGPGGDPWSSRRNGPSRGPPNNGMTPELMARMQRVLLGPARRGPSAAAAAGGEAPEAPEPGSMNPMLMAAMMQGMPGAAGGGEGAGLASLLGAGGGGANPLLSLLGSTGGSAGEGPSGMNMQSMMLQALQGGGGGGGLGALAGMGNMGSMGSLASLMGGPAAEGTGSAGFGMNLFGAGGSV